MKRFAKFILVLLVVLLPVLGVDAAKKKTTTTTTSTTAAGSKVNFYIFYGSTCQFCAALHEYVAELQNDPTINYMFEVVDYEVWGDKKNNELMAAIADEMNYTIKGVPIYVIGDEIYGGYEDTDSYNNTIRTAIEKAYKEKSKDVVAPIAEDVLSGARSLSESNKNKIVGYVILGVTVVAIIAIVYSKKTTTYYYDDEEEETTENEEVVKKTSTKNTTTKKKKKQ